jgi:hypothetical protein
MHNIELINLKFSHSQSTFRHVSVVATAVNREFTLQAKTSLNNVWQYQQWCDPNNQQVFVWQTMRYGFYGQGLKRKPVFDKGVQDNHQRNISKYGQTVWEFYNH